MRASHRLVWLAAVGLGAGAVATAAALAEGDQAPASPPAARHQLPASAKGNLVVGLCDGDTALEVDGVAPGQVMDRSHAQQVASTLMTEWRRKNPTASWQESTRPRRRAQNDKKLPAPGPPSAKEVPDKRANVQVGTYSNFAARDEQIWRASTQQFIERGHQVFHDVKELGGTTGISCDMCHPDGANTHPETYPKYQVQLGRVALLRDMINWCIENPVRGKPLADGDERMRAMEAYIYAQRKGTALDFGKR
jgi:thiosulfate dehydrogenase